METKELIEDIKELLVFYTQTTGLVVDEINVESLSHISATERTKTGYYIEIKVSEQQ